MLNDEERFATVERIRREITLTTSRTQWTCRITRDRNLVFSSGADPSGPLRPWFSAGSKEKEKKKNSGVLFPASISIRQLVLANDVCVTARD